VHLEDYRFALKGKQVENDVVLDQTKTLTVELYIENKALKRRRVRCEIRVHLGERKYP
jgi:hypothetical protein